MSGLIAVPGPVENENAALLAKNVWLEAHPGGEVTWPAPDCPHFTAAVDGDVIAEAALSGGLEALMDDARLADTDGRCPLHPLAAP